MSQEDLNIRKAETGDTDQITRLIKNAYHHYIDRIGKLPGPMLDDYAEVIAKHLAYVAESENEIIGFVVLMEDYQPILLDNIAVDPRCQGKGIGLKLLQFVEQMASNRGHQSIQLYTNELMHENIDYYGKHGYSLHSKVSEKGYNWVYMEKKLT